MVRVGAQALMKFWSGRLAIRPKCGLASINFAPVRTNSLKEFIGNYCKNYMIDWMYKKTNLADCDQGVGSFLNDGEIRTWKEIRYASLMLTPFKAADSSALIDNTSVLQPWSPTKNCSTFKSKNFYRYFAEHGSMIRDVVSWISDPDCFLFRIPDAGFKKPRIPDPYPQLC